MTFKTSRLACTVFAITLLATPAFAVNKDMVQLQTQIQQLQDAVARLQQSNDERMGVMKDLVQQTADSVNKMSAAVDTLQKQMAAQQDGQNAKIDQVSGQIQSFNDSLDELKARLGRIEKSLSDIQSRQQSMDANLQGGSPAASAAPPSSGLPPAQDTAASAADLPPASAPVVRGKPSALVPLSEVANGSPPTLRSSGQRPLQNRSRRLHGRPLRPCDFGILRCGQVLS